MNNRQNIQNQNLRALSESSIAYSNKTVNYGYASPVEVSKPLKADSSSLTLSGNLNFFFSEYFKGFLFVVLTSLFIVAIPKMITEQGSIRLALYNFCKRTMDILGSLVGILLTLPLWIIVPILIKLDSPGPIFYSQTRVGINRRKSDRRAYQQTDVEDRRNRDRRRQNYFGELFEVLKFRTMVNNAEAKSGPVWASKNDSRITKLGKFLRKTRIDEIPQFINVLRGEMSLVGPRPERPKFVEELSTKVDSYTDRLKVKPGLTGLAQVTSGYDDSIAAVVRKVELDREYIENRSILNDIKILFKTVSVVFTGKGAH